MANEDGLSLEVLRNQRKEKKFPERGKIFLIIGVLLLQALVAYVIVKNNYPAIREYVEAYRSTGGHFIHYEDVIINPQSTTGSRYLITSLAFEFHNQQDHAIASNVQVEILDVVNMHLRMKTVDEINSLEEREKIRIELIDLANNTLGRNMVRNLFFTKYVIQ